MIIIKETKNFKLTEVLQRASTPHLSNLLKQMNDNPELLHTMTTPISQLPKYEFLTDDAIAKHASLLEVIEFTLKKNELESYFIVSSKGLYVGFIAISIATVEKTQVVNDIKVFSFGLPSEADENTIYKDIPKFLDDCLKRFSVVTWKALKGNRANIAYEIYRRKHKGLRDNLGIAWRYTCFKQ